MWVNFWHSSPTTIPWPTFKTTAKLDRVSHGWVASLANYNFQLYSTVGKANIDADAMMRVSWPMCVPNALGTHHQVTTAVVWAMQKAAFEGPMSPIGAYSCDLHVFDLVEDGLQVTCMSNKTGNRPSWQPPSQLGWLRMQDRTLVQYPYKLAILS